MSDTTQEEEGSAPLTIDRTANAIATRRNQYAEQLNTEYIESYGTWLSKQAIDKQTRIKSRSVAMKHGLATSASLLCFGSDKCPFYNACPIPDTPGKKLPQSEYPIGKACVLEAGFIQQKIIDYITELNVDPYNAIEMSLVQELALLDLFRNRAVMILSQGDKRGHGRDMLTIDESIVGFSADGEPLTSQATKMHPAIEIMDKHEKRRTRILEQFVSTRASKFKLQGGQMDSNTELFQSIQAIRGWMEQVSKSGVKLPSSAPILLKDTEQDSKASSEPDSNSKQKLSPTTKVLSQIEELERIN